MEGEVKRAPATGCFSRECCQLTKMLVKLSKYYALGLYFYIHKRGRTIVDLMSQRGKKLPLGIIMSKKVIYAENLKF